MNGDAENVGGRTDSTDTQLARLTAEKLRLEIHSLSTPWWRTPANLGPVVTIAGAIIALVWGVASGFFDISRRELDVRRREVESDLRSLQERRDAQTRKFEAEAKLQRQVITNLRRETADRETIAVNLRAETELLKKKLSELDQPILTSATVMQNSGMATIDVGGYNFGSGHGSAHISLIANCPVHCVAVGNDKMNCESFVASGGDIEGNVMFWSQRHTAFKVSTAAVLKSLTQLRAILATEKSLNKSERCELAILAGLTRPDKRYSNILRIAGAERVWP
jgi:hypothetical protein